jgi:hypothetical protein
VTKARDIADFKFENITDTGTEGTKLASGTTAQRGSTTGQFRFNSTTGKFEGRTASGFATIEPYPVISSVDDTEVDSAGGGNQTFVITGENFSTGDVTKFIGNDGTEITATTTTIDSGTQITAVIAKSSFVNSKEPYDIKIIKATNLSATLDNQINVDNSPAWQTASGSLGTINHTARTGLNISTSATDAEGDTVAYAVQSGSLPAGLSLNTSTGAITGDADAVGSDTTSSFTLRATAGGKTADRAFTITIRAIQSAKSIFNYSSSALQTFTIPSGLTSVNFAMWGAGSGRDGSNGMEGTGGFGSGTLNTSGLSTLYLAVGQSGTGALGRQAGAGLSGIFSANSVTQGNAIAICGGGGGSSESAGSGAGGGGGGGLNQSGTNGTAGRQGSGATGGSVSGGGAGAGSTGGSAGQAGSALQGGGAPGYNTTWTTRAYYGGGIPHTANNGHPGGCGGAGYYGGGGGSDYYGTGGGGGSGYADTSIVSNIVAIQGNADSNNNPTNSSHADWDGEISRGTSAGHGRIVISYEL